MIVDMITLTLVSLGRHPPLAHHPGTCMRTLAKGRPRETVEIVGCCPLDLGDSEAAYYKPNKHPQLVFFNPF